MNVKKVLQELGRTDIEVSHAGINDAMPQVADLFVCSSDVYDECKKAGDAIPLDKLTDIEEIRRKLVDYFASVS